MSELGRPFLSPELRGLIARERHAPDPPDRVKREVAERIDRSLDLGGVMVGPSLGVAAAPPPLRVSSAPPAGGQPFQPPMRPSVPAPPTFFGWKTAGTAIAVVVAGAAALSLAMRSPRPAMNHVAHAVAVIHENPVVVREAASHEIFLGDVEMLEGAAPSPAHPHRAASAHHRIAVDTLAAERTVLDGARAALVRRDGEGALASVRSHQRSFPHGQLVEERESMRVQALALSNEGAALKSAGAKFLHRFPRSMFRPAVEQALENEP